MFRLVEHAGGQGCRGVVGEGADHRATRLIRPDPLRQPVRPWGLFERGHSGPIGGVQRHHPPTFDHHAVLDVHHAAGVVGHGLRYPFDDHDGDEARKAWRRDATHGVGLVHPPSELAAIDHGRVERGHVGARSVEVGVAVRSPVQIGRNSRCRGGDQNGRNPEPTHGMIPQIQASP